MWNRVGIVYSYTPHRLKVLKTQSPDSDLVFSNMKPPELDQGECNKWTVGWPVCII